MAESDDSAPVFRRNLVVYCSIILFGVILEIPAATIIERLLGLGVGQVSPVRVWLVQVLIFLYLSHRYYFSKHSTLAFREFKATKAANRLSWKIKAAKSTLDKSRPRHTKFPTCFNLSREEVFEKLNAPYEEPFSDENSELQLDNPSFAGDWSFEVTPALKSKNLVRAGNERILNFELPIGQQRWIRFRSNLDTVLRSEQTTEFLVPILVSSLAGVALFYRWVDPSLFASVMHSCVAT